MHYYTSINSFALIFLLSMCIILFIVLLISIKTANYIYSPVKSLIADLSQNGDLSDKEDFNHIKNSFNALNSEKNKLISSIKQSQSELKDFFLFKAINGTATYEEIKKYENNHDSAGSIPFPTVVCLLKFKDTPVAYTNVSDEFFSLYSSTRLILEDSMTNLGFHYCLGYDMNTFILFASCTQDIKKNLINLISQIYSKLGVNMMGAIGSPAKELYDLHASFDTANNLLQRFMNTSGYTIVFTPEDTTQNYQFPFYSSEESELIINLTLACDTAGTHNLIEKIISRNVSKSHLMDRHLLVQIASMLYFTIQNILYLIPMPDEINISNKDIYEQVVGCQTPKQLTQTVCGIIDEIINCVQNMSTTLKEKSKQDMINYIHTHYQEDISLSSMSEFLNMSQSYISKQFKKLTGENFKDYLTKYRIDQAVRLFRENPTKTIQSVAEAVGYNNTTTFSRAFMQCCGIQPGKFKERLFNSENHE